MPVDLAVLAGSVFESTLRKVSEQALSLAGGKALKLLKNVSVNFGDHLKLSYEKCRNVRTILNREESVDLLLIYVNLRFLQGKKTIVDDYDIIDQVPVEKRIVVVGSGGGGKTFFMRYLWISLFEGSQPAIPLYIELRKFNDMKSDDFIAFLFHSVIQPDARVDQSDFEKALKKGAFVFILDGFDEINLDRRNLVEREIIKLSQNYPELSIIVSSRPDDKFDGWSSFTIYHVRPFEQDQVLSLIDKLSYDTKVKRKFVQRIRDDLYKSHASFLSNPLLATMMLLTFDQFADIPEKIYLFYEQAFDTLFAKHDATKEAYKRNSHTKLPIDSFKDILSYFCLISYYEGRHEYTETEVRNCISKAKQMSSINVSTEDFLLDLRESVCILQKEGLNWVYTHRSFQEYFAAYGLSVLVPNRMKDIIPGIVGRLQDNVLRMCYDMNRETLEREYIIPNLRELIGAFSWPLADDFLEQYVRAFHVYLVAYGPIMSDDGKTLSWRMTNGFFYSEDLTWDMVAAVSLLYDLFSDRQPIDRDIKQTLKIEAKVGNANIKDKPISSIVYFRFLFENMPTPPDWARDAVATPAQHKVALDEIRDEPIENAKKIEVEKLKELLGKLESDSSRRQQSIDKIFGLN